MKYGWQFDQQPKPDQDAIRRVMDRYPDHYLCRVARPTPDRWTFWLFRGDASYLMQFYQANIEQYSDELQHETERALKALEDVRQEQTIKENDPEDWSMEDYNKLRLSDHERTLSRRAIEQELEAGVLSGLEHLVQPRLVLPGDSLFLPGQSSPVIDHLSKTGRFK